MSQVINLSVEEQLGTFTIDGAEIVLELDTPTTTPIFTNNTGLIRGDKAMQFRAVFTPGGWVGQFPLPGWTWQFEVCNEVMGPNNAGEQILATNIPHNGNVLHQAVINVPANTYPPSKCHFTFTVTLLAPGGIPTPVVALAHIDIVRIFNSIVP